MTGHLRSPPKRCSFPFRLQSIGRTRSSTQMSVFVPGVPRSQNTAPRSRLFPHLEGARFSPERDRPGPLRAAPAPARRWATTPAVPATLVKLKKRGNRRSVRQGAPPLLVGDAEIGRGRQPRPGTITCNYPTGVAKHRTDRARAPFVGSNTMLVAPVRVGAGAVTASGRVVTKDVPDADLAHRASERSTSPTRGGALTWHAPVQGPEKEPDMLRSIVGISLGQRGPPVLFEALKRLDTAAMTAPGFATVDGGRLRPCAARWGLARQLSRTSWSTSRSRKAGIGHTRWCDHRAPTAGNAPHPHRAGAPWPSSSTASSCRTTAFRADLAAKAMPPESRYRHRTVATSVAILYRQGASLRATPPSSDHRPARRPFSPGFLFDRERIDLIIAA